MTHLYLDLGSDVLSVWNFCFLSKQTSGGIVKRWLFPQATKIIKKGKQKQNLKLFWWFAVVWGNCKTGVMTNNNNNNNNNNILLLLWAKETILPIMLTPNCCNFWTFQQRTAGWNVIIIQELSHCTYLFFCVSELNFEIICNLPDQYLRTWEDKKINIWLNFHCSLCS